MLNKHFDWEIFLLRGEKFLAFFFFFKFLALNNKWQGSGPSHNVDITFLLAKGDSLDEAL